MPVLHAPTATFAAREKAKAEKKNAAADKKRKSLDAKAEAAERRPKRKAAAKKRKQGEDSGDEKKSKAPRTRNQGEFVETDPNILKTGSGLSDGHKVKIAIQWKDFLETILQGEPCILRFRKGAVRKVLSKSLELSTADESKEWINQASKSMGMKQANAADDLRKLSGDVRKNITFLEKEPLPSLLALDVMLLAGKANATPGATGAHDPMAEPWLIDKSKMQKELGTAVLQLSCIEFLALQSNK